MDKEWRREMVSLRDSMFECPDCEAENYFNIVPVKSTRRPLDAAGRPAASAAAPPHSIA